MAAPKARTILVNGAVRKGERLMPPSALDLLLRVNFPTSSARVKVCGTLNHTRLKKMHWMHIFLLLHYYCFNLFSITQATERFEAIYPILKEVALAGVPGSKGMKLVSQQILTICAKAAEEGREQSALYLNEIP